jgi:hypothetical protein
MDCCGCTRFRADKLCSILDVASETHRNTAAHLAESPTLTQSLRLRYFPCYLHVTTATHRVLYIRLLTIFLANGLDVLKNHDRSYGQPGLSDRMDSLQVDEFKTRQNPYLQEQQLRIRFKVKYKITETFTAITGKNS